MPSGTIVLCIMTVFGIIEMKAGGITALFSGFKGGYNASICYSGILE
jgi:hypothetical protein